MEDTALVLEAIRPIITQQKVVINLLERKYENSQKEWMFKETALLLQLDKSKKALAAEIKARRREKKKAFLKGAILGAAISVALSASTH
ncbi:hypothetical protein [Dyadobacter sp. LHD-138]|uniref:hypothetical protein n=1 Tax=Dyadobacter sp. LHD-138 TaxID=3071413 RepID=UPI0027DF6502|nr:hypothetical protein [Dyadobacter sp. LHD-138]MDQ6482237.1 hypothetical protein [Dyadobacter sp. LHD-138]